MEQTRIYTALKGVRGRKPIDLAALEELLVRFSQLVVELPLIREIDINPLLASPERLLALDARVVVHGREIADKDLPRTAIRPYPAQYVKSWQDRNGAALVIRPICPEDEPLVARFHEMVSEHSVYLRYLQAHKLSQRVAHARLSRMCFIDYDREMALIADRTNPQTGQHEAIAVGRLIKQHGKSEAEFALLVADRFQKSGLGTELLRRLLEVARDEHLLRVTADILPENRAMQRVCEKLGFRLTHSSLGLICLWVMGLQVFSSETQFWDGPRPEAVDLVRHFSLPDTQIMVAALRGSWSRCRSGRRCCSTFPLVCCCWRRVAFWRSLSVRSPVRKTRTRNCRQSDQTFRV
jgi:acetyltransferase